METETKTIKKTVRITKPCRAAGKPRKILRAKKLAAILLSVKKMVAALMIVSMNWSGLAAVGVSGSMFLDSEGSLGNLFSAGTMNFSLYDVNNNPINFQLFNISNMQKGESQEKIVHIKKNGSLGFQYSFDMEGATGGLCSFLTMQAMLDSDVKYSGPVQNGFFHGNPIVYSGSSDDWKLKLTLNSNAPENEICNFKLAVDGKQIGGFGFVSKKTIDGNYATAGLWQICKTWTKKTEFDTMATSKVEITATDPNLDIAGEVQLARAEKNQIGLQTSGAAAASQTGFAKATKTVLANNTTFNSVNFYSHAGGNARLAVYDNAGVSNWPMADWNNRKSHVITGSSGAGTNYQVRMIVHKGTGADIGSDVYLGNNVRDDFGDVRFTASNGSTLLDYWLESGSLISGSQAAFWVEIGADLSSNQTIYIYYGNSGITTTSSGASTFVMFDDFDGNSLDTTNKWRQRNGGTPSLSGGFMTITSNSDPAKIIARNSSSTNYAIGARFKVAGGTNNDDRAGLGVKTTNSYDPEGYNYLLHDFESHNIVQFLDDDHSWGNARSFAWDKNAFYSMEAFLSGTNLKGRINYGNWDSQLITATNWSNPARTNDLLSLNIGSFGATTVWDWAYVRRVIANEPANSLWGIEEGPSHPNNLLWQSADISFTSGWNRTTTGSALNLAAGTYWFAWQWNTANAGPSKTSGAIGDGYSLAMSYGNFANTWSGGSSTNERWSEYLGYSYFDSPGTVTMASYNGGQAVNWRSLSWNAATNAATVNFEYSTSADNSSWTSWSTQTPDTPISITDSESKQYIRWRATLANPADEQKTPVLTDVTACYVLPVVNNWVQTAKVDFDANNNPLPFHVETFSGGSNDGAVRLSLETTGQEQADQTQGNSSDTYDVYNRSSGTKNWGAQTYIAGKSGALEYVTLKYTKKNSPTTFTVEIRSVSGDVPGSTSGTILGTTTASTELGDNVYRFSNFSPQVNMVAGTKYAIIFHENGTSNSNNYYSTSYQNTNIYSAGDMFTSSNGGTGWVKASNQVCEWQCMERWFGVCIDWQRVCRDESQDFQFSTTIKTSSVYYQNGYLESQAFNGGGMTKWSQLSWNADTNSEKHVVLEAAISNDGTNWSAWQLSSETTPIDVSSLPESRYFKWRMTLSTTNTGVSPVLNDVTLNFDNGNAINTVKLNEFLPNPTGADDQAGSLGEWVELYNTGVSDANLENWYIKTNTGTHYPITTANTNKAGSAMIGDVDSGSDKWLVVYLNAAAIDNTSDTISLYDQFDNLVDTYTYNLCDSALFTPTPGENNGDLPVNGSCETGIPENKSYARIPDGTGTWYDPIPTPGGTNELSEEEMAAINATTTEEITPEEVEEMVEETMLPIVELMVATGLLPESAREWVASDEETIKPGFVGESITETEGDVAGTSTEIIISDEAPAEVAGDDAGTAVTDITVPVEAVETETTETTPETESTEAATDPESGEGTGEAIIPATESGDGESGASADAPLSAGESGAEDSEPTGAIIGAESEPDAAPATEPESGSGGGGEPGVE